MDVSAFFRNWKRAGTLCPNLGDRIKYLRWIYDRGRDNSQTKIETIRFATGNPAGSVTLSVRLNHGADAFIFSEIFIHKYYDFTLPKAPETILDLGANIGFASLFFARKYPRVKIACVEPIPENVSLLKANLENNSVTAHIHARAVSVNDQPLVMQRDSHDYGHKVRDIPFGKQLDGQVLRVEAITVHELMQQLGWKRIGLLKIDIEGYEGVLLRENNEWLRDVDTLCIECHEGFGEKELRSVADDFGFRVQKMPGTWLLTRE